MDADKSGTLTAKEVIGFFKDANRGDVVNEKTLACILDLVDADGDDNINYNELSKMILCDDILELLALVPDKSVKSAKKADAERTIGTHNCTTKELQAAATLIKEKLLTKHRTSRAQLTSVSRRGGLMTAGTFC
jgi:hypothetical protein